MLSRSTKAAAGHTAELAGDDVREHLGDVAEKSARAIDETLDKASAYANETGRKVRSTIDKTTGSVKSAADHVTDEIKNNPIQSSLIALGAGVVLGALLRR